MRAIDWEEWSVLAQASSLLWRQFQSGRYRYQALDKPARKNRWRITDMVPEKPWTPVRIYKRIIDILILLVVVTGLSFFILGRLAERHRSPALTDRPEHAGLNAKTQRDKCLVCHAPNATVAPMITN